MKISHHQHSRNATVDVYPVLYDDGPTVYYLRARIGRGTGSLVEPSVYAEFSESELYTFAVDILGMIAKESHT